MPRGHPGGQTLEQFHRWTKAFRETLLAPAYRESPPVAMLFHRSALRSGARPPMSLHPYVYGQWRGIRTTTLLRKYRDRARNGGWDRAKAPHPAKVQPMHHSAATARVHRRGLLFCGSESSSAVSPAIWPDRKSTRLNSSHLGIS